MSTTPISFPILPQYSSYCTIADIRRLIGNVAPVTNGDIPDADIQTHIDNATAWIEDQTQKFFSPRRLVEQYDGSGTSRMVLPNGPIMYLNEVDVYFTYPLALVRIAHDWDLMVDRNGYTISFPPYSSAPFFAPFAYQFFKQSRNVTIDAWYGYTRRKLETLKTSDNTNYSFANPGVPLSLTTVYNPTNPPVIGPLVYVNGVLQVNRTYTLVNSATSASANNQWQIASDNLIYTTNTGANGITSITFNTPVTGATVTADYHYWLIPADVADACAKKVAVTMLTGFATASFPDQQFQGVEQIMVDGTRIQSIQGQWGSQIAQWDREINAVIRKRKSVQIPLGIGFTEDTQYS